MFQQQRTADDQKLFDLIAQRNSAELARAKEAREARLAPPAWAYGTAFLIENRMELWRQPRERRARWMRQRCAHGREL